jgi:hypothetical protein
LLCLDPGVRSTGYAFWYNLRPDNLKPDDYGVWRAPSSMKWQAACRAVTNEASEWFDERRRDASEQAYEFGGEPEHIVCEWPQLWGGSAKSYTSAERGDLLKLAFLLGRLQEVFEYAGFTDDMSLVTPQQWKAQASKRVIIMRLERWTGIRFKDHEADAVGMGMHLLGKLP